MHPSNIPPPRAATRLLQWLLKEEYTEEVLGDLEEGFDIKIRQHPAWRARMHYWYQVLHYLRPFAMRQLVVINSTFLIMFKNYLLIASRNLTKHKFHSSINILSLAIGIAACLVIYLFIADERSFDAMHQKNIYRLCEVQSFPGTNTQNVALSMPAMGPTLNEEFPDLKQYTRYWNRNKRILEVGEKQIAIDDVVFVDSTFFHVFDFPLLAGDKLKALVEPRSLVISEESSLKLFGDLESVGKTVTLWDQSFKVTGLMKDIPENSHLQFDVLVSMSTQLEDNPEFNNAWGSNFLITYFEIQEGADIQQLEKQFAEILPERSGWEDMNDMIITYLQPLPEVHLGSLDTQHDYQNYRKFNGAYLDIFSMVGIFILIIAGVNFMNLSTARASKRAKEVGIRKAVGAQKPQLFWQFIVESTLMAMSALVLAILIDLIALPFLNVAVDRELSLMTFISVPVLLIATVATVLLLGLLAGLYPSLHLSSFKPAVVLKGSMVIDRKSLLKSSLVVTQFSLVLAMIVATFIVLDQLNFMRSKDIGFDTEQMMLIEMGGSSNEKFDVLKSSIKSSSHVGGVTASGQRLGNNLHQWGFKVAADTGIIDMTTSNTYVDYDYLDVYGIELVSGRGFSKAYARDDGLSFVINESLAKELPFDDALGKSVGHGFYPNDSLGTVIGITKDFNYNSLHHQINTLSLVVHEGWSFDEMSVKITGNVDDAVQEIAEIWRTQVPEYPFSYSFLDDHFDELYKSDQQMSTVVAIIAVLSILIGSLGLFGLSAIAVERRIKEVGVRKVLGASVSQILLILSSHFALLILISFLIAAPVTYYFLFQWLENFAFRVDINPVIFLLGGFIAFSIAMLTISYHTLRAANTNPVKSLKYE